jgi:hypothetical protein
VPAGVEVLGLDQLDEGPQGRRLGVAFGLVQGQRPPGDQQGHHDQQDRSRAQSTDPHDRQQNAEQAVPHHRKDGRSRDLAQEVQRRGGTAIEPEHQTHQYGTDRQPGDDRRAGGKERAPW